MEYRMKIRTNFSASIERAPDFMRSDYKGFPFPPLKSENRQSSKAETENLGIWSIA